MGRRCGGLLNKAREWKNNNKHWVTGVIIVGCDGAFFSQYFVVGLMYRGDIFMRCSSLNKLVPNETKAHFTML